jgi:type IV secretion system protein VirB9
MKLLVNSLLILLSMLVLCQQPLAAINKPVTIDSRIKTLVYSENEVFRIVVNYGYQTEIEFADGELVQNITSGNNFAWQLTPLGRRLFIKPLEDNMMTNMTIITNLRAYHFEVQSKSLSYAIDEELVYVVRFFYPDQDLDAIKPEIPQSIATKEDVQPIMKPFNFNYTLSGSDSVAPTKVFDDGINTFLKFPDKVKSIPKFTARKNDTLVELTPRTKGEYVVLNTIAKEIEVLIGDKTVVIYNEQISSE